ncbi:molybdopterin-dependent oxidoreductase, partial [Rhizobium ruizarguesonis]
MPTYRPPKIASSEITPRQIYVRRREFLGAAALGAMALYSAGKASAAALSAVESKYKVDEKATPIKDVTTYNNFYEFGLDKGDPAALSGDFKPLPWTIKVDGMVNKPGTFDLEALMKEFPIEERTYRMRCVEAWSMVIPWDGF